MVGARIDILGSMFCHRIEEVDYFHRLIQMSIDVANGSLLVSGPFLGFIGAIDSHSRRDNHAIDINVLSEGTFIFIDRIGITQSAIHLPAEWFEGTQTVATAHDDDA